MKTETEIARLIEPSVAELGYELVRASFQGTRPTTLQIMAERIDRRGMRVEDCAKISRRISVVLDEAEPDTDYMLEVSSPGIDRPLMKRADYERFDGHEAKLDFIAPIDGRKRVQGNIGAVSDDGVTVVVDDSSVTVPFAAIRRAKLVLTDRLIAAATLEAKTAGDVFEEELEDDLDVASHVHA
jgi:ribosome maturation factor RimP